MGRAMQGDGTAPGPVLDRIFQEAERAETLAAESFTKQLFRKITKISKRFTEGRGKR